MCYLFVDPGLMCAILFHNFDFVSRFESSDLELSLMTSGSPLLLKLFSVVLKRSLQLAKTSSVQRGAS